MACGGGFNFKMVDGAAKDMYCGICALLIKEATMFNCGHLFCNVCAIEFIQNSKQRNVKVQCPMSCDKDIFPLVPIPAIDRMISSLIVYCDNRNTGCDWKGEISDVEDHLQKSCAFREVSCEKCSTVLFHKDLEKHLADCVDCPNKCGERMSKDEVHTHLEICPAQLVLCPFHNVGCLVSMLRNSIQEHMKLSVNDHLLLVVADSQKTRAECTQLQHGLGQEIKLLKENGNLQRKQMKEQQNKIDMVVADSQRTKEESTQLQHELQQEIKLLKENGDLQRKQMEVQQKRIDLLEEGEKIRQHESHEPRQEIGILTVKIEEQELKITKLTKTDEEQQKEIKLLKEKEKNQETEIRELQEAVEKKQAVLPPSPEIEKHLQEISKRKFEYINELLRNKNTSPSTFELLLTHNPHIIDMRSDYNSSTVIHSAASSNRADVLALLLSVDTSHVDDVDNYNNTALMYAVAQNHIECVRVLLANNADVNIKDRDGSTPLSYARKKNYVDIIRLLEEHRK